MKVAFVTFGCRLNHAESLDLEAQYSAGGHEIVELGSVPKTGDPRSVAAETYPGGPRSVSAVIPDLILVRGCSVTAKAQRACEKAIEHLRSRFPTAEIRTIGCLPSAQSGSVPPPSLANLPTDQLANLPTCRPLNSRTSRAFLKIQDGCSGKCAFCIVPHFRGKPVSVPFDDIMLRAKDSLASGYREIVLTGCNLSLYHSDRHNLSSLLSALATMGTDPNQAPAMGSVPMMGAVPMRIRLGSLEPGRGCEALLDVMEKNPNICKFLHISLQSGSDRILKRMNRPYDKTLVERFCMAARERLGPDLALGADIITGFPGETAEDFAATRDFLNRHAFSNLHVFPYSERPNTPAATMDGAIPRTVRLQRARELTELGKKQRAAFAQTFLGREVEVCVERGREHGWTSSYLPCKWKGPAERRSLILKRVIAVEGDTLIASTCPPETRAQQA